MNKEWIIDFTLAIEDPSGKGEVVQDPDDPGGLTRWGISQRAHSSVDVANLSRDDAVAIYDQLYWRPIRGDDLPSVLALALFDFAVHDGPADAISALQHELGVKADHVFGPQTLDALTSALIQRGALAIARGVNERRVRVLANRFQAGTSPIKYIEGFWLRTIHIANALQGIDTPALTLKKDIKMASYRTTICGILLAVGIISTQVGALLDNDPATTFSLSAVTAALGAAGIGFFARDNKVTSEQVGAGK